MQKTEKWIFRFFLIFGIVFLIAATAVLVYIKGFQTNGVKTEATITSIISINSYSSGASQNHVNYDVHVKYFVNGREYNQTLNSYNSSMQEGGKVTIYYNPQNPEEIMSGGLIILPIIFYGVGAILFLTGLIAILAKNSKSKSKTALMNNGRTVYADIENVEFNMSYSVNYKHPYKIICKWTDPVSGNVYTFKSENIWDDPKPIIEKKEIKQLPVYVDENNYKKYYVEINDIAT